MPVVQVLWLTPRISASLTSLFTGAAPDRTSGILDICERRQFNNVEEPRERSRQRRAIWLWKQKPHNYEPYNTNYNISYTIKWKYLYRIILIEWKTNNFFFKKFYIRERSMIHFQVCLLPRRVQWNYWYQSSISLPRNRNLYLHQTRCHPITRSRYLLQIMNSTTEWNRFRGHLLIIRRLFPSKHSQTQGLIEYYTSMNGHFTGFRG